MNRHTLRPSRGVSLIEVLLAAGVLAAVMIPVMITFGSSNRGINMTSEEFIAHTAGIELLEQTMAVPFALLPTGNFPNDAIQDNHVMDAKQSPLKFRISPVVGIKLEREMETAARNLQFEKAAMIRDKIKEIKEGSGI